MSDDVIDTAALAAWLAEDATARRRFAEWRGHNRGDMIEQRNRLLLRLAGDCAGIPVSMRARTVASALSRYLAGSWRAERTAPANPHPPGDRALLWEIARLSDRALSVRQMRKILALG